MKLGIVYRDGKIINHRSLLKVIMNPIMSWFGYCIASEFDDNNNYVGIRLIKSDKPRLWEIYRVEYDYIEKKRILY